jgi:hypothetical protein
LTKQNQALTQNPLASFVPTLTKGRENFFQEKRFAGLTEWGFGVKL